MTRARAPRQVLLPALPRNARVLRLCARRSCYPPALAAQLAADLAAALGVEATVVMPERTPLKRRNAIERQGAKVIIHGKGLIDAKMEALRLSENSPELTMVQPHEDPQVIAGQATAGLEIVRQIGPVLEGIKGSKDLDAVFITAGGSSLLAGVAAVIKQITPRVKVIGVEAEGADLLAR